MADTTHSPLPPLLRILVIGFVTHALGKVPKDDFHWAATEKSRGDPSRRATGYWLSQSPLPLE